MQFLDQATSAATQMLRDAAFMPYWLDDAQRPAPLDPLVGDTSADLLIVGGGFTGLWSAIRAKQAAPQRDVLLVDGDRIAGAASGRNGGFVHASLTHGLEHGIARFPAELRELTRLGHENLQEIRAVVAAEGIDCDWRDSGELEVAFAPHHAEAIRSAAEEAAQYGEHRDWLDARALARRIRLHGAVGATFESHGVAMVHPARLAWGLLDLAQRLGVRMHERTSVRTLQRQRGGMCVATDHGRIDAEHVLLATNAHRSLLPAVRRRVVPVYDYVLVTEPLSAAHWDAIGWDGFEGVKGAGNRFHYARRTADGRMLWGGYDAVYHRGGAIDPRFERDSTVFARLATHFTQVFPDCSDVRFSHAWAGVIDTCTRFTPFINRAFDGSVVAVAGYTGLGVGSSRFMAGAALAALAGEPLGDRRSMLATQPMPFPPEPLRTAVIAQTQRSLAKADAESGHRGPWLRLLDGLGVGFDS